VKGKKGGGDLSSELATNGRGKRKGSFRIIEYICPAGGRRKEKSAFVPKFSMKEKKERRKKGKKKMVGDNRRSRRGKGRKDLDVLL